jgi:hypothetical protein
LARIKFCLAGFVMVVSASGSADALKVDSKSANTGVPDQSFVLRIRHKDMGVMSAHMSKCGLLMVSPLASLLTTPPKYETVIYNTEKKNYISFPVDAMDKRIRLMTRENDLEDRDHSQQNIFAKREQGPWQINRRETLLNLDTSVYRRITTQSKGNGTYVTMIDDVWICRDSRFMRHASQFGRIISFLWHTPELDFGIPLKRVLIMAITDKKGNILRQDKPSIEYTVLSCKEEKTDAARFKVPPGFTKSVDEVGVIGLSSVGGEKLFH